MDHLTKEDILFHSQKIFHSFTNYCNDVADDLFFYQPDNKWSIAQTIQHLIQSLQTATLPYQLPKLALRILFGTPNRQSKTFSELENKYEQKLLTGSKASSRYIPKSFKKRSKKILMQNFINTSGRYIDALKNNKPEQHLDAYLVPHPLLGKITLRELCYFTIFHTSHHLKLLQLRTNFLKQQ